MAARQRFETEGFRRTNVADIAADAGVAAGTIYWHFESKEGLFLKLIQEENDLWVVMSTAVLEETGAEGPFQAWRIDHQEMNYEYLGDRIATSAPANFRVFADDIANHAAGSYFTPSARAYLDDHRTEDAGFKSCELHAKAVQLHVLLRRTMRGAS